MERYGIYPDCESYLLDYINRYSSETGMRVEVEYEKNSLLNSRE
jgi:hypothetical protein